MTAENIFESVSYIDSALIERSAEVLKKRRFVGAARIAASVAAALMLAFGGFTVLYNAVLANMTSDNKVPPVIIAEIDGAHYLQEGFHSGNVREAYGLPEPSENIKGEFIGSYYAGCEGTEDGGYVDFYALNIDVKNSVLLGERDGELSYWVRVFGGTDGFDTVRERLEYYGYGTVDDVHSVKVNRVPVEDGEKIAELWDILISGREMTIDDYRSIMNMSDGEALRVTTETSTDADGVRQWNDTRITLNYGEGSCCVFYIRVRLNETK